MNGIFTRYRMDSGDYRNGIKMKTSGNQADITLPDRLPENLSDLILVVDYSGGSAGAYLNGTLKNDHLFHGQPWQIGLKRFLVQPGTVMKIKAEQNINKVMVYPQYRMMATY